MWAWSAVLRNGFTQPGWPAGGLNESVKLNECTQGHRQRQGICQNRGCSRNTAARSGHVLCAVFQVHLCALSSSPPQTPTQYPLVLVPVLSTARRGNNRGWAGSQTERGQGRGHSVVRKGHSEEVTFPLQHEKTPARQTDRKKRRKSLQRGKNMNEAVRWERAWARRDSTRGGGEGGTATGEEGGPRLTPLAEMGISAQPLCSNKAPQPSGSKTTEMHFSQFKGPAWSGARRQTTSFLYPNMVGKGKGRTLGASLQRALIPPVRAPSQWPNPLPKAVPLHIIL